MIFLPCFFNFPSDFLLFGWTVACELLILLLYIMYGFDKRLSLGDEKKKHFFLLHSDCLLHKILTLYRIKIIYFVIT